MSSIKEVAKLADVATSTVSRVLSNKGYIHEQTRKRVMDAVQQLNYHPNTIARSLKRGESSTIALIIPSLQNHIYPEITAGIESVARQIGYSVVLCNTNEDKAVEIDYIHKMRNHWVDGFIIGTMRPDFTHIKELFLEGIPLTLIARHYDETMDAVAVNNYSAAFSAVDYLIKTGNRRIAIVSGDSQINLFNERYLGYRDALLKHGLAVDPNHVIEGKMDDDSLHFRVKSMLMSGERPDAIFATSDPSAIVVMRAIGDCNLSIPGDISVMGFDNIKLSAMLNPPLSTVSQPLYKIGEVAMRKLYAQICAKRQGIDYTPRVDILDADLVIRKSTR